MYKKQDLMLALTRQAFKAFNQKPIITHNLRASCAWVLAEGIYTVVKSPGAS